MNDEPVLASVAQRGVAFLIDALLALVVVGLPIAAATGQTYHTSTVSGFNLGGWSAAVFFALVLGLLALSEWLFGTTPGKRLLGLRVIDANGGPISARAAVTRNALRLLDAFPYVLPYVVGGIAAVSSDRNQRLGDRAGATIVIQRAKGLT